MVSKQYWNKLFDAIIKKNLQLITLGEIEKQYIFLIKPFLMDEKKPNLLIAAGFHGEEIAGPLGILRWLEISPDCMLKKVNLSFLPCVSPMAFNMGIRYARRGEKTNAGFCHKFNEPSKEGKILLKNIKFLVELAKDGFLSLHEDVLEHNFYVYSYDTQEPSKIAKSLRDVEAKFFKQIKDGTCLEEPNDPDAIVTNGIVSRLCDGSLEDYFMHKGIRSFVTETPGKCRISRRIDATKAIINEFIRLSLEE